MSDPLVEVAAILAAGIRRLHARSALCIGGSEDASMRAADPFEESLADDLEVSRALPLHGRAGLTRGEASAPGENYGGHL